MEECSPSFTDNSNLSRIFLKDNQHNFIPIIAASSQTISLFLDDLSNFKHSLSQNNTQSFNIEEIGNTLTQMKHLIDESPHLATIFLKYTSKSTEQNLFIILCDLYLNTVFPEIKEKIISLLTTLLSNVPCPLNVYNYICRKIRHIFIDKKPVANENISVHTMEKYLSLLDMLYGNIQLKAKALKSYMYFNGDGDIQLDLKFSPLFANQNAKYNLTKLSYGLFIHMWLYIEFDYGLLPETMLLDKEKGIVCKLIHVEYKNSFFEVIITKTNEVRIYAQELEKKELGGKYLPLKKWIQFKFEFSPRLSPSSKPFLTYFISEEGNKPINLTETNPSLSDSQFKLDYPHSNDKEIKNITLCENFIGRITNILVYNTLPSNRSDVSSSVPTMGNISKMGDKKDQNFYIYEKEIDFKKIIQSFKMDNKTTLYCVLSSKHASVSNENEYKCILNNIITNSDGILNSNNPNKYNGVIKIDHLFNNIRLIGGINNILPIGEILYKYQDILIPDVDKENNLLLEYLNMINSIINKSYSNIENAIQSGFFTHIKVLLSHFSEKFFTQNLVASLTSWMFPMCHFQISSPDYINLLICSKILGKFKISDQIVIWNKLVSKENDMHVLKTLTMEKICFWIKNYDCVDFGEYCCQKHYDYFIHDNNNKEGVLCPQIMAIPLRNRIECLMMFANGILLSDFLEIDDIKIFFGMLTLEISPCLQLEILSNMDCLFKIKRTKNFTIEIFIEYINKILLDILKYVFAVGLYDIKAKVIEVMKKIISSNLIENEENKVKEMFYMFKENITIDHFEIKIDNIKESTDNKHSSLTSSKIFDNKNNNILKLHLDQSECIQKRNNSKDSHCRNKNNLYSLSPCVLKRYISKSPEHLRVSYGKNDLKTSDNNPNDSSKNDDQKEVPCLLDSETQMNQEYNITDLLEQGDLISKKSKRGGQQQKQKSKKIALRYPNENNQLRKYMNVDTTENEIFKMLVSLLDSKNLPITKYKLIIKSFSSIPNMSHLQFNIILSLFSEFKTFNQDTFKLLSQKKYFINWFIETSIFMQLIYKRIFPDAKSSSYKVIIENIIKLLYEIFWKKILSFIIKNEKQFIEFLNNVLNYIIYFSYIAPGIQNEIFLSNYLEQLIGHIRRELDEANYPNKFEDLFHSESPPHNSSKKKKDNQKMQNPYTLHEHFLDVISYEYIMNFPQNENESSQQILLNYLTELPSRKINQVKSKENWREFSFFYSLWERLKVFWDYVEELVNKDKKMSKNNKIPKQVLEFTDAFATSLIKIPQKSKERDKLLKFDEVLNIKEINKLKKVYSINEYMTDLISMPFLQILSNLFMIFLRLDFAEINEKIKWMNNYQFFIVYCILLTCKVNDNTSTILEPLILTNYAFILKHFLNEENSFIKEGYTTILINITQFVAKIMIKLNQKSLISINIKGNFSKKVIENVFKNIVEWNSIKDPQNPDVTTLSIEKLQIIAQDRQKCLQLYEQNQETIHQITIDSFEIMISQFREEELDTIKKNRNTKFIKQIEPFYSYTDIMPSKIEQGIKINSNYISVSHYMKQKELFVKAKMIKQIMSSFLKKLKMLIYVSTEEKCKYISVKKSLFSWNSAWSESEVFYDESSQNKLKFKVSSYTTSNYMRPYITPILDINYYLPVFSQFDVKTLFLYKSPQNQQSEEITKDNKLITNDDIYDVELNFNNIFKNNITKKSTPDNNTQNNYIQKQPTFIKYLYSNRYELNENSSSSNDNSKQINKNRKSLGIKEIESPSELKYNVTLCCIVKQSHHIHCFLEFGKNQLKLLRVSRKNSLYSKFSMYNMWDSERNTCYGSHFEKFPKAMYFKNIFIPFSSIHMILKRNYFYENCAIEIFTHDYKSIFIHFKDEKRCRDWLLTFFKIIPNKNDFKEIKTANKSRDKDEHIIGYIRTIGDKSKCFYYNLNVLNDNWKNWKMSNFDYLMFLNLFANRSYFDLSQYPVMPWVVKDYNCDKIDLNSKESTEQFLRDLHCPIGMLELCEEGIKRKVSYLENYKTLVGELKQQLGLFEEYEETVDHSENQTQKEIEAEERSNEKLWTEHIEKGKVEIDLIPYYYGSHYSNPMYVSHFLMRLFPYSSIIIELQGGKFDDPQRLFLSVKGAFKSATTHKTDVREIIPEFFYLPEMFLNINQLNMGKVNILDEKTNEEVLCEIQNALLPKWTNDNPYKFISMLREILDSDKVNIIPWIELIFGVSQSGKKARKNKNLFFPYSYASNIDLDKIDPSKKSMYKHMFEIGVTPHQLFFKDIQNKIIPKQIKEQCTLWHETLKVILTPRLLKSNYFPTYYSLVDSKKILIIFSDFTCGIIEMNSYPFAKNLELNFEDVIISDNSLNCSAKITHFHIYLENNIQSYKNHTYAIYNKGKNIVVGGFWEGSMVLYLRTIRAIKILLPFYTDSSNQNAAVTCIHVSTEETKAFCGLMNGLLYLFEITSPDWNDNKDQWKFSHQVRAHSKEITSINHNSTLRVVATTSYDGYVNIYRETDLKLMRSVYIKDYDIDKVFLVASPLPSFVVYSMNKKQFKVFGINSTQPIHSAETEHVVICYKVIKDHTFCEFIVYGNDNGEVVIAKLPFLEVIRKEMVFDNKEKVRWVEVSEDIRTIYAIGDKGKLAVLCDKELVKVSGVA